MLSAFVVFTDETSGEQVVEEGKCGDDIRYTLYDSGRLVMEGTGYTYIELFSVRDDIVTVEVGEGITSLGEYLFTSCESITSVTLCSTMEYLGRSVFDGCFQLKSIIIPDDVKINEYAFGNCISLETVEIGKGNSAIDDSAFNNSPSLRTITVDPDNSKYSSDGGVLFDKDKEALIQYPAGNTRAEYTIPNSVKTVSDDAFFGCSYLETLEIGKNVEELGDYPLRYCFSMKAISVSSENQRYSSEDGVLFDKEKVNLIMYPSANTRTSYRIPDSVKNITSDSFTLSTFLEYVIFPSGLENIGSYAFSECISLKAIDIGGKVTDIEEGVFDNCWSIESFTVVSDNPKYSSVDGVLFDKSGEKLIKYPSGNTRTTYSIPEGVKNIEDYSFEKCAYIRYVVVSSTVNDLYSSAFDECLSIESFTVVSNNPKYSSEDGVLFDKSKDVLIKYPAGNTRTSYTVPDGVKKIRSHSFENSPHIKSVTISGNVEEIYYLAFSGCDLNDITVVGGEVAVDDDSFNEDITEAIVKDGKISHGKYSNRGGSWKKVDYTVIFVTYDGGPEITVYADKDTGILKDIPADPTRKGYSFIGWFNGKEEIGPSTVFIMDATVRAKWDPNTIDVTFDGNGGKGEMQSQTIKYGDDSMKLNTCRYTSPDDKKLHYFAWNTSMDGTGDWFENEQDMETYLETHKGMLKLFAQWTIETESDSSAIAPGEIITFTISTYEHPLVVRVDNVVLAEGDDYELKDLPSNGEIQITLLSGYTKNLTLGEHVARMVFVSAMAYIEFDIISPPSPRTEFPAVYYSNGGSAPAPEAYNANLGETITVASYNGIKDGYAFGGWLYNGVKIVKPGEKIEVKEPINLMAVWIFVPAGSYTVTFDTDGGSDSPSAITVGEGCTFTVPEYKGTKDGYTFKGWSYDGKTYKTGDVIKMEKSDITMKAAWEKNPEPVHEDSTGLVVGIVIGAIVIVVLIGGAIHYRRMK